MKKILFDTNIYGRIVVDAEKKWIHAKVHSAQDYQEFLIYGFVVIRKELRAVKRVVDGMNLRSDLLKVYDDLVKKTYPLENEMERLAEEYFNTYLTLGGTSPKDKLFNDFLVIACASIKNLDVVVSDDSRTMLGEVAVRAYQQINDQNNYPQPGFISYEGFKNELKK